MGSPYTSTTVSGYNSNPPADDGSQVAANQLKWATIKTKLSDPLNTFASAENSALVAAFAKVVGGAGVLSTGISYTVLSGDQSKLIVVTAGSTTIVTPDATSVGSPFVFGVLNTSAGNVTLDGSGTQTINGSLTLTMSPGDGWLVYTDGSNWFVIGRKTGTLPRGYIDGCIMSNGTDATNDINIAAGVCRDSTNAVDITVTAMAGKQLDANWAAGAAAGMRNSAAGIADGTYHIYAVAKNDGTQDIYAHTSATIATVIAALQAESGGSAYAYARLIGSIVRKSSAILGFSQDGDEFLLTTIQTDVGTSTLSGSTLYPLSVPTGIKVRAMFAANMGNAATDTFVWLSSPDEGAQAANVATGLASLGNEVTSKGTAGHFILRTDTSGQIRASANAGSTTLRVGTYGWIHQRGKNS